MFAQYNGLGLSIGTVKDKVFVSLGNEVRGYGKKGKMFMDFGTNQTEIIKSMAISGLNLLIAGTYVYNHYVECRDANYYLSEDVITDILTLPGEKVCYCNILL